MDDVNTNIKNVNTKENDGRWREELLNNLFSSKWLSCSIGQQTDGINELRDLENEMETMYGKRPHLVRQDAGAKLSYSEAVKSWSNGTETTTSAKAALEQKEENEHRRKENNGDRKNDGEKDERKKNVAIEDNEIGAGNDDNNPYYGTIEAKDVNALVRTTKTNIRRVGGNNEQTKRGGSDKEEEDEREKPIGFFEMHTKGVAGKIMKAQGWERGKGLGKETREGMKEALNAEGQPPSTKTGLGYTKEIWKHDTPKSKGVAKLRDDINIPTFNRYSILSEPFDFRPGRSVPREVHDHHPDDECNDGCHVIRKSEIKESSMENETNETENEMNETDVFTSDDEELEQIHGTNHENDETYLPIELKRKAEELKRSS